VVTGAGWPARSDTDTTKVPIGCLAVRTWQLALKLLDLRLQIVELSLDRQDVADDVALVMIVRY